MFANHSDANARGAIAVDMHFPRAMDACLARLAVHFLGHEHDPMGSVRTFLGQMRPKIDKAVGYLGSPERAFDRWLPSTGASCRAIRPTPSRGGGATWTWRRPTARTTRIS